MMQTTALNRVAPFTGARSTCVLFRDTDRDRPVVVLQAFISRALRTSLSGADSAFAAIALSTTHHIHTRAASLRCYAVHHRHSVYNSASLVASLTSGVRHLLVSGDNLSHTFSES